MAGETEVRSLLLKVDASVELLRKNLAEAGTSIDTFTKKGEVAATRFDASMKRVNASSGQMRAGFQQLSFQLGDVATQLGSGTSALQVFSQQSGQVVQSIGLMTGNAKGFIGFLGGPWGLILTSAITLLITFGSKLLDAGEAAKLAEAGADSLGAAQSTLGGIFDLTSGKIKNQNELLLANARLMASNLRSEALAARTQGNAVIARSQNGIGGVGTTALLGRVLGIPLRDDTGVSKLLRDVQSGALRPEEALRFADTFDLSGSGVDRNTLRQAIIGFATADDKERVADLIDQSLRSGSLAPGLRKPERTKRPEKPRTPREKRDVFADLLFDAGRTLDNLDLVGADKALADKSRKFYSNLGIDPEKDFKAIVDQIDKRKDAEFEANQQIAEDELRKRAENIRTLSGLYVDAFQGGTKAIFRDFKQIGLQVIAELLARFTLAQIGGQKFDFGSALGSALAATGFGGFRAGGGPVGAGTPYIVGERGPELFVPKMPGSIIPNGARSSGGVSVTINAPGATAETVSMIRREIAGVAPAIIQAAQKTTLSSIQRPRL